jgi:hypothetical protein
MPRRRSHSRARDIRKSLFTVPVGPRTTVSKLVLYPHDGIGGEPVYGCACRTGTFCQQTRGKLRGTCKRTNPLAEFGGLGANIHPNPRQGLDVVWTTRDTPCSARKGELQAKLDGSYSRGSYSMLVMLNTPIAITSRWQWPVTKVDGEVHLCHRATSTTSFDDLSTCLYRKHILNY